MNHQPHLQRPALVLATLAAALALAGCSTSKIADPATTAAPVETRTPGTGSAGATPGTAPQSGVATVDLSKSAPAAVAPLARVVYFDFDSFVVKDEFKPLIDSHARALTGARGKQLVVEGHTDERGGREYNLALGQKRAAAVVRSLTLLGVPENQLEAVSFGEERPAAAGSDEQAWAQNRRAELRDR